uniref:DUF3782 domain-containing protein n=3 Tax=Candidatus Kentrum sp. SD TaxID=2126332 RepID=A0A450Z6W7_9GAMM|nr:MAG: hypothetical protein BECKSD772E_GA0070983_11874 [Candidatus Kentron sp. SD]
MNTVTYEEVLSLFKETDLRMQETGRQMQETDRQMQETDRRMQETGRQIKELGYRFRELERVTKEQSKQISGIGNKFGYFTEGLALPSMERILTEQFGMTTIMPRARTRKNGEEIEIDVLATANEGINLAMVVEVKSRVGWKSIEQLHRIVSRFREIHPEHRDKEVIGILAGVDWDRGIQAKAREAGFLTASIQDEIFELTTPEGFEARRW